MERQLEDVKLNDNDITHASEDCSQICRRGDHQIDLDRLLDPNTKSFFEARHIMSLREPGTDLFEKRCPICVFMTWADPAYTLRYEGQRERTVRMYDEAPTLDLGDTDGTVKGEQRFFAICERFEHYSGFGRGEKNLPEVGFLFPIPRLCDHQCPVQIVDRNAVSYDRITRMIDDCAANHHAICNQAKETKYPLQLYVVDCLKDTIVPLCSSDQYVALSYVWGMAADLAKDSTWPPPEIPLTIRDSMEVTRCLGYRFLWVDRYCIPQVDIFQRHEAIANMDQVYAGAVFTIVALHGDAVDAGLPGVSTIPRSSIQQVRVRNGQLRLTFPPLEPVIDESVWATRGWTFQELRLSPRCLFFTGYQVYFSCSEMTLSEALPHKSSIPTLVTYFESTSHSDQMLYSTDDKGFFLDRVKYTKKTLTYQNDILDAFRGIIGLHPFVTLWGIPITCMGWQLDPCVGFAMGLLWQKAYSPHLHSSRRPGFPTWSWTSAFGKIQQDHISYEGQYARFLASDSRLPHPCLPGVKPAIQVEIPNLGESLAETVKKTKTKMLPEASTSIIIEGDVLEVSIVPPSCSFYLRNRDGTLVCCNSFGASIDTDRPLVRPSATTGKTLDALVIVNWSDSQPKTEVRFVLMLLRWVGDNIAERVGLLGHYSKSVDKTWVDSLWRRHVRFELR